MLTLRTKTPSARSRFVAAVQSRAFWIAALAFWVLLLALLLAPSRASEFQRIVFDAAAKDAMNYKWKGFGFDG